MYSPPLVGLSAGLAASLDSSSTPCSETRESDSAPASEPVFPGTVSLSHGPAGSRGSFPVSSGRPEASFGLSACSCPTESGLFSGSSSIRRRSGMCVPEEVSGGTLVESVPSSGFWVAFWSSSSELAGDDSGGIARPGSSLVEFGSFCLSEITLTASCNPGSEPKGNGESAAWAALPNDARSPSKSSRVCVYMVWTIIRPNSFAIYNPSKRPLLRERLPVYVCFTFHPRRPGPAY